MKPLGGSKLPGGLLLIMALLSLPQLAWATCALNPGTIEYGIATSGPIRLPRDLANNSVIATLSSNSRTAGNGVGCTGDAITVTYIARGGQVSTNGITPTGIPGIGYLFTTGVSKSESGNLNGALGGPPSVQLKLVKTGPIAPGAIVPKGDFGRADVSWSGGVLTNVSTKLDNDLVFTPQTCIITKPGAVNLGAIPINTLKGVGSASRWGQNFTINVNCTGVVATHVAMVFTDTSNAGNTSSTLSLTPTSTATGVGIQIWQQNGGAPIAFGPDSADAGTPNQFWVFASDGASNVTQSLVFSTRYIQTAAAPTAGTANGQATFTMSYQ